jgi:hypothetical protein
MFMRPERTGGILTPGGDIDNRMKTLMDALSLPHRHTGLPPGARPTDDEAPHFFCLLEDDNLVSALSVRTGQLLEAADDSEALVLISVKTRTTVHTWGNLFLS